MSERQFTTRFCPYCCTEIPAPTKYCETCGAEISWSISEFQVPPYPWSPKSTYLVTILTYSIFFLILIPIMAYYLVFFGIPILLLGNILLMDPLFFTLLSVSELIFIVIPLAYVTRLKVEQDKVGVKTGGPVTLAKDILLGLVVGIAMVPFVFLLALYEFLGSGSGIPSPLPGPDEIFWLVITFIAIILIIAPAEEYFFRGFIQNSLDAHYGNIGGLLVASIIFGLVHANPFIGIIQTILGVILGLLFQWRGRRLAGPIAAHAIYDVLLIFIQTFFF